MTSLGSITNLLEKKERGREEIERKKGLESTMLPRRKESMYIGDKEKETF